MIKKCLACKKEKGLQDFHKDKTKKHNVSNYCKPCQKKRSEAYRRARPEEEYKRKRNYYEKNKESIKKKNKKYYQDRKTNKIYKKIDFKENYKKNRIKILAHQKVHQALKKGELTRGKCLICSEIKTEAHHEDYSKPLIVKWLCKKHHRIFHSLLKRKIIKDFKSFKASPLSVLLSN